MYGPATEQYFDLLPDFPELTKENSKEFLTSLYIDVIGEKLNGTLLKGRGDREAASYVRRLITTLELYGIFRHDVHDDVRSASAFIAAEAMNLLNNASSLSKSQGAPHGPEPLSWDHFLHSVETSLLYYISGMHPNASIAAKLITYNQVVPEASESAIQEVLRYCSDSIRDCLSLDYQNVASIKSLVPDRNAFSTMSVEATRCLILWYITNEILRAIRWVFALGSNDIGESIENLHLIFSGEMRSVAAEYPDLYHITRLTILALNKIKISALRKYNIDLQQDNSFKEYVRLRIPNRPLVWESASEFSDKCIPELEIHAAVSMPTGSGKSFLAELAVAAALQKGWAIYIVPTNALARQVRRDLSEAFANIPEVRIRSFFTAAEYVGQEEHKSSDLSNSVLIVTPEKASILLRQSPEIFHQLRLCVIDECHLLGSTGGRGVLTELVAAHIAELGKSASFVLMSALIDDPTPLAEWLKKATGKECLPLRQKWRPTRTLKGIVGYDGVSGKENLSEMEENLLSSTNKTKSTTAPIATIFHLQGAWKSSESASLSVLSLPVHAPLRLHKVRVAGKPRALPKYTTKNEFLAAVTATLSSSGEKVIGFVLSSKHHVFSTAREAATRLSKREDKNDFASKVIKSLLDIADYELGVPTPIRSYMEKGVAVHSRALIDPERMASEFAFKKEAVNVIIATTSLSQGLNLPATYVVIAGNYVGDQRKRGNVESENASRSDLLNALGRAGRAHVGNYGIGFVIPDEAVMFKGAIPPNLQQSAGVLQFEDASWSVSSKLSSLFDGGFKDRATESFLSEDERIVINYLPSDNDRDEVVRRSIMRRSLAASFIDKDELERRLDDFEAGAQVYLQALQDGQAEWNLVRESAYLTGLPLHLVRSFYDTLISQLPTMAWHDEFEGWIETLISVLEGMPDESSSELLFPEFEDYEDGEDGPRVYRFDALWMGVEDDAGGRPDQWNALRETVRSYTGGHSLIDIARHALYEMDGKLDSRSDGAAPIPRVMKILDALTERLSRAAGLMLAIMEGLVKDHLHNITEPPERSRKALQLLSLAVRHGCGTWSSLAWFRFGVPLRRTAHLLASWAPLSTETSSEADERDWIGAQLQALQFDSGPTQEDGTASIQLLTAVSAVIQSGALE